MFLREIVKDLSASVNLPVTDRSTRNLQITIPKVGTPSGWRRDAGRALLNLANLQVFCPGSTFLYPQMISEFIPVLG